MATHHHTAPAPDKGAAFTGLVVAAVFLFVVVFSIVKWTNGRYAHEGAEGAPAAAETH